MIYFQRNGVQFKIPIAKDAVYDHDLLERQIKIALIDLQSLKDRSPDIEQMRHELPGRHVVRSIMGKDEITIIPPTKVGGGVETIVRTETISWPTLGISLTPEVNPAVYTGDIYNGSLDPVTAGFVYYMDDEAQITVIPMEAAIERKVTQTHKRLTRIGQDETQDDDSVESYSYPQKDANIIFVHEFADRTIRDSFGNAAVIDPVIFTCGDYEPVLPTLLPLLGDNWAEYEYYSDPITADEFNTIYTTTVTVDGATVATGVLVVNRPYNLVFQQEIRLPDYIDTLGIPEEQAARCCYPDGVYQLYEREDPDSTTYTGEEVFWNYGESTDQVEGFERGQFGACLYDYYRYDGSTSYYYELRFWASDGHEFVVHSGTDSEPDWAPDDLFCQSFRMFNFNGIPVVTFGIMLFPDVSPQTFIYGIYFNGNLYLTSPFLNDKGVGAGFWNRHDISNYRADKGLEGYGDTWAFGIEELREYTMTVPIGDQNG